MRRLLALLAAAACGCMGPFEVQVVHVLPNDREAASRLAGLEPLYVEVVRPPRAVDRGLSRGSAASEGRGAVDRGLSRGSAASEGRGAAAAGPVTLRPDVRGARLAAAAAGALQTAGVRVSAFSAGADERAAGAYVEATGSAGVLRVTVVSATVSVREGGSYSAELETKVRLLDASSERAADDVPMTAVFEAQAPVGKALSAWYEENEKALFEVLARKLVARYGGRLVARRRPVLSRFDTPESSQAMRAARRGDWRGAQAAWSLLAGSGAGDWRDDLDLGVAAEREKRYGRALELYEKARAAGRQDPEGAVLPWDEMASDVKWALLRSSAPARAGSWFSGRVAVLPFERPEGGGDGPDIVRGLVAESLCRGGYDAEPADDADAAVRLGAQRLLKGRVDEFNDAVLGSQGKRSVAGGLSLWDVREKKEVWSEQESLEDVQGGLRRAVPSSAPGDAGLRERLGRSPLGYEIQLFVERCLESLPMSPGARGSGRAD